MDLECYLHPKKFRNLKKKFYHPKKVESRNKGIRGIRKDENWKKETEEEGGNRKKRWQE